MNTNLHPIMAMSVAPFAPPAEKANVAVACFEVDLSTDQHADPIYAMAPVEVVEKAAEEVLDAHADELEQRVRTLMRKAA